MRLRNVPGSREAIADSPLAINEPKELKGKWNEEFGNNNPIRIEIGMGKGKFITQLAMENPDINYVGIEKYSSVLIRAIEKCEDIEIKKGEVIGQAIFQKYLVSDDDSAEGERLGGFGSTNK